MDHVPSQRRERERERESHRRRAAAPPKRGVLARPDPLAASDYMTTDIWFEDCGDGGVYVMGHGGDVLLTYVDAPGDAVLCRYTCPRKRWGGPRPPSSETVTRVVIDGNLP